MSKPYRYESLTMAELDQRLRRLGAIWFRNDDLLLLEEALRRMQKMDKELSKCRLP